MSNPYFERSPQFGKSKPSVGAPSPYGVPGQRQAYGQTSNVPQGYDPQFQTVEQSYYGPAAGSAQTGRMTYDDVIMKTAGLLAIVVGAAAVSWLLFPGNMAVMLIGLVVGLVLGRVNSCKREPSPALIVGYAAFEGLFLGGISGVFEMINPGIVLQAVLATFVTFAVTLALFKSGKVRVTPKFTKFLLISLVSYGVFSLVNLGIMWFTDLGGAWGIRSVEVFGIPLGVLIGLFAVGLAAMSLIMDFDMITKGIRNGAPRKYAWSAAFGITVTLVWLYIEFLRLLMILRGNN